MQRCRGFRRKPETWTELVDSGADEYEVAIALLSAAKELIEDQEREIAELKKRLESYETEAVRNIRMERESIEIKGNF